MLSQNRVLAAVLVVCVCQFATLDAGEPSAERGMQPIASVQPTHVTIAPIPYFRQMAKPGVSPDGFFPAGTPFETLRRVPSYYRVRVEDGTEVLVTADDLAEHTKPATALRFTFSAESIRKLQDRACTAAYRSSAVKPTDDQERETAPASRPRKGLPWKKSSLDPMAVLDVFTPMRIKNGYVLRGYRWAAGGNAEGVVWALPEDAEFPEPARVQDEDIRGRPKPPSAIDNLTSAIEGDRSPWSYLCASILYRDLDELGARWHGMHWTCETILDHNPVTAGLPAETHPRHRAWKPEDGDWTAPEPDEWSPVVVVEGDKVIVTFHTYGYLGREHICRHVDTYTLGSYEFERKLKILAWGPIFTLF